MRLWRKGFNAYAWKQELSKKSKKKKSKQAKTQPEPQSCKRLWEPYTEKDIYPELLSNLQLISLLLLSLIAKVYYFKVTYVIFFICL